MGHTSAVMDIKYSPTGKEFVTGSYDKTLRIFDTHKGISKDIYHTKRMQRLTHVSWSLDNKYIMSASNEMNIRIWKAKASEKLGVVSKLYYNYTYYYLLLLYFRNHSTCLAEVLNSLENFHFYICLSQKFLTFYFITN